MRNFFLTILIIILTLPVSALEIYYPNEQVVKKNSNTTFFIGKAVPSLSLDINGENVEIHESGGFAHFVNLPDEKNIFTIKSGNETLTYTIIKEINEFSPINSSEFKSFLLSQTAEVTNYNTPLRATPVDYGMNRLSHLPQRTQLKIDGEKGDFYKVFLADNKFAWVKKSDVQFKNYQSGNVFGMKSKKNKKFYKYEFITDKRLPFIIEEKNGLTLTFYNVSNFENGIYSVNFPVKNRLWGYDTEYDKKQNLVLKIRKEPKPSKLSPLKNLTIAIDAGHGGKDCGAIGCLGTKEKDVNLKIAEYLSVELKKLGAKIVMTRTGDEYIGLYERVKVANNQNSLIFLSLHNNALPDTKDPMKYSGSSVFYYYPQSKDLAQHILNSLTSLTGLKNDGLRQQSFAVIRNSFALATLIEFAYLINPTDNALIIQDDFQKLCARAVAQGVLNWFENINE